MAEVLGFDLDFKSFDAYKEASDSTKIEQAINYQKAASSIALVVDIGSTVFVDLVKQIEGPSSLTPGAYAVIDDPDNAQMKILIKVVPSPGGGPYEPIYNDGVKWSVKAEDLSDFNFSSGCCCVIYRHSIAWWRSD